MTSLTDITPRLTKSRRQLKANKGNKRGNGLKKWRAEMNKENGNVQPSKNANSKENSTENLAIERRPGTSDFAVLSDISNIVINDFDVTTAEPQNHVIPKQSRPGDTETIVVDQLDLEPEQSHPGNTETVDDRPDVESAPLLIGLGNKNPPISHIVTGRRIIDLNYFLTQIRLMQHHPTFDCNFQDMDIIDEHTRGYGFTLNMKCRMCGIEKKLHSEPQMLNRSCVVENEHLDVTSAAVAGALNAGVGLTALTKITTAMNIPKIANDTFSHHQKIIGNCMMDLSVESMIEANKIEKQLAIQRGDISPRGFPRVPVVIDGAWCKRKFGGKGREATGGIAVIMGLHSGLILFLAIMNSYCYICKKAENKGEEPLIHQCFKNWTASAQQMESDGARKGFAISEEEHGVHYSEILGDGEMSLHKKILEDDPYKGDTIVGKIECSNHLLRNFCNKLNNLASSSSKRNRNLKRLKNILGANVRRVRGAVEKAAEHWRAICNTSEAVNGLRKDIENAPHHVFGDHKNCMSYFCDGKKKDGEVNRVAEMRPAGLLEDIDQICLDLARHARSLLAGRTTNMVESFNAMVATHINGKRVNYTGRGGYNYRLCLALLSKNDGGVMNLISKHLVKKPVGRYTRQSELNLLRRRKRSLLDKRRRLQVYAKKMRKQENVILQKKKKTGVRNTSAHYGPNSMKPDMSATQFEEEKVEVVRKLVEEKNRRKKLEVETRQQADSMLWYTLRKRRITASNFGLICKMKLQTNTCKTVNNMLYGNLQLDAFDYGKNNESKASKAVSIFINNFHGQRENNISVENMRENFMNENVEISATDLELLQTNLEKDAKVEKCGIYIHDVHPFLAASPDGILGNNFVIELKCPFKCKDDGQGQSSNAPVAYIIDGKLSETHNYCYQVQGQLEMTDRPYCLFAVWSPARLIINIVKRKREMWLNEMEPFLCAFYNNCLIYEIVDPRKSRSMDIRNFTITGELALEKKAKQAVKQVDQAAKDSKEVVNDAKPVKRKSTQRKQSVTRKPVPKKPKIETKKNKIELQIEKRKKKASMKLSVIRKGPCAENNADVEEK